jgi:sulfotransferase family protein
MMPTTPDRISLDEDPARLRTTPIFVLGTFHSGTTILYRMLAMHPDTTWFSQFSLRDGRIPGRRRLPLYAQIDRISRRLIKHEWRAGQGRGGTRFAVRPTEGQLIWQHIIPRTGLIDPDTSVLRMRSIIEAEGRRWKKAYFLAKYPYVTRHIPLLNTAFPHAKFVHSVRDGRAVALSLAQRRAVRDYVMRDGRKIRPSSVQRPTAGSATGDDPTPSLKRGNDSLRLARYWLDCIEMVQAEKDQIDLIEIRYEDLCQDVHACLERLLTHIGLAVDKFPFQRCPVALASTNETRMQAVPRSELDALEDVLGDGLRRYSYV